MKIHILYNFQQGPWGGGNQFLKALKKELSRQGFYEQDALKAEVILLNSHHNWQDFYKIKKQQPNKIGIFRLDGPISLIRGEQKYLDKAIKLFSKVFMDGIVFQSHWCREKNKALFGVSSKYETVVHNAPDRDIFKQSSFSQALLGKKPVKLIASSWSPNLRKGFAVYKFLDQNLDFSKFQMTFVGNSPLKFRNIKILEPVNSGTLAEILREYHIYITASQNDPCSNSLIEALSCGLPAVAKNDGGHPELVKGGGELFNGKEDIIEKIEKVAKNHHYYKSQIPEFSIEEVAQNYYEFAQKIYDDVQNKQYKPKLVNLSAKINFYKMKFMSFAWKVKNKLKAIKRKT